MSTAGGLLFIGTPGGVAWGIAAYNATTGQQVWSAATDASVEAAPMTYSVNGKQYVAMYAGGRNDHRGLRTPTATASTRTPFPSALAGVLLESSVRAAEAAPDASAPKPPAA